ncbi:TonB-dependent siderophore receptor [Alkalilimnicola ehrlichii]|uniref:TonB-dependent receptor plug domain-containing protein n=1 Tax=Alkalilimnicola ehrlichii TaxID=351052 RepID=UPI0015F28BC8|nr:TonB-dependent receptor [Alkalilimnicola ehrlichii]
MTRKLTGVSLLVCLAALSPGHSTAAPVAQLSPLAIPGTATDSAEDAPVRTQVLTRAELEQRHSRNLNEALSLVPGLYLREIHGKEGQELWIQGLDADRVLILIDGERPAPTTGSSVDLTQIGVLDIERIEIIRGATSALYGSSAMGGVVNVITRQPESGFNYQLEAEIGSYDDKGVGNAPHTHRLGANLSGRSERFNYRLTADRRHDDGFILFPGATSQHGHRITHTNLSGRFGVDLNDRWSLELRPSYSEEDKRQPYRTQPGGAAFDKLETVESHRLSGALRYDRGDGGTGLLRLSGERFDNRVENNARLTDHRESVRKASLDSHALEIQWNEPLSDRQLATLGARAEHERMRQQHAQTNRNGETTVTRELGDGAEREHVELYAQNEIALGQVELVPGARLSYDDDFGSHFAPSLNLRYGFQWPMAGHFHAGVGRGYRVPNLKERYFHFDHSRLGYIVVGNPALKPEESTSTQLGVELQGQHYQLDINLFHNELRNFIVEETQAEHGFGQGITVHQYQNVERARTRGVELGATFDLAAGVLLSGGYTYLEAVDRATGQRLPQRPRHQLKTELAYQWRATQAALEFIAEGSAPAELGGPGETPAWQRWNLRFNQAVGERLTLYFGVDNLLDEHRDVTDPHDTSPLSGRLIYSGLRLRG